MSAKFISTILAAILILSGCVSSSEPKIVTSPELMKNDHIFYSYLSFDEKYEKEKMQCSLRYLKGLMECSTQRCVDSRPRIAGYDAFSEEIKEKALIDYVVEARRNADYGRGEHRVLVNLAYNCQFPH